ncbi:MAG: hypothetical protein R8K21_04880 [Mariprofundales bacterium]
MFHKLLKEVQRHGAQLSYNPEDDRIYITAPQPLPSELMGELSTYKMELRHMLENIPHHLHIVQCRHCSTRFWHDQADLSAGGKLVGCPACFGQPIMNIKQYPNEADAMYALQQMERKEYKRQR